MPCGPSRPLMDTCCTRPIAPTVTGEAPGCGRVADIPVCPVPGIPLWPGLGPALCPGVPGISSWHSSSLSCRPQGLGAVDPTPSHISLCLYHGDRWQRGPLLFNVEIKAPSLSWVVCVRSWLMGGRPVGLGPVNGSGRCLEVPLSRSGRQVAKAKPTTLPFQGACWGPVATVTP